ncbi:MAG: carbohydrate kinase [Propionibacteriaceae bacterium]|jgi:fructokinase|nr:carbohydrate kinase [Propionibacteriaceae bacterium]
MSGPRSTIAVVGETLTDVVVRPGQPDEEHPGGSCANVAVTLGRLGRNPILVTQVADDERGSRALGWLEESGVRVVNEPPSTGRTSTATARLDATGSATYDFDLTWDLATSALAATAAAHVLHVGSIATVLEPGADTVEKIVRQARGRALISFDPNARPTITPDREAVLPRLKRLVSMADIVKVSEEDLAFYAPGEDALTVARRMLAPLETEWLNPDAHVQAPLVVIVTLGAEGVLLLRGENEIHIPKLPVDVVDTIGAGDTFSGALLDALVNCLIAGAPSRGRLANLHIDELRHAVAWAATAAAITVSRAGADPPSRTEVEWKLRQFSRLL